MPNTTPKLTGDVHVAPTADHLYDDLAAALMGCVQQAIADRGAFHLALSGGSTPEPFYHRLVIDPRYRAIPWEQTHLWIVDERRVPEDDDRCNYKMIRESLADHVPTPRRQRHPIPVLADDPATAYENKLRSTIQTAPSGSHTPHLDFILLGMGADAHTASLFPGTPAISIHDRLIAVNKVPPGTTPDVARVTMTYPLINAAGSVAVLVTGAGKSQTLARIQRQLQTTGPDPDTLPITGVQPTAGSLTWYLDRDACP